MSNFGENIRFIRKEKGLSLEKVSRGLGIDIAVLSKVERGKRSASRQQVEALAAFFDMDLDQLLKIWLSDKLYQQVEDEAIGLDALKLAEETLTYATIVDLSVEDLQRSLKKVFKTDKRIKRVWIFGSYSRSENTRNSDVDLLIEVDEESNFSFYDLAEIQFQSEKLIGKTIDIGVSGTEKEQAKESIFSEKILIYEK